MNSAFADEVVQNTYFDEPFSVKKTIYASTKDILKLTRSGLESNPDFQKFEEQLGVGYDLEIKKIKNKAFEKEFDINTIFPAFCGGSLIGVAGYITGGLLSGNGTLALATGAIATIGTGAGLLYAWNNIPPSISIDFKITANEHAGADLAKYVGENAVYLRRYDNGLEAIEEALGKTEADFDLGALATESQRALLYLSQEDYSEDVRPLKTLSHQMMQLKEDVAEFAKAQALDGDSELLTGQVQSNIDFIAETLKEANDRYVDTLRDRVAGNLSASADVAEFVAGELKDGMEAEPFKLSSAAITRSMLANTSQAVKLEAV